MLETWKYTIFKMLSSLWEYIVYITKYSYKGENIIIN